MSERPREESPEPATALADGPPSDDEGADEGREALSDPAPEVAVDEDASDAPPSSEDPSSEDLPASEDTDEAEEDEEETSDAIRMTVFGLTDVGQIREHNEDNLILADLSSRTSWRDGAGKRDVELDEGGLLLVVCDGMGGAAAGEVASQLATDIIFERMLARSGHGSRDKLALDIVQALEIAGTRILEESTNNRACRGMGTTATVAALVDDYLLLGQVGDSRAYILRGEQLVQVTRDQSLVNQLIEAGQLTEEEAENFEHSNIILQALGTAEAVQVDLTFARLRQGDVLMMCSDGLSGMIRNNEIRDTLVHVDDVEEACRVLVDDANQAGGHDNITIICAQFDGEGLRPPHDPDEDDPELRYTKYKLPPGMDSGATLRTGALFDEDTYDDTPSIEITGEFEIDPETNWEDLLDPPLIPKDQGPIPNVVIWVAVFVLAFALYYFLFY